MDEREVVITGMGAVTPLGRNVASTWAALVAGTSGIGPITAFDASPYKSRIAGEVRDYQPPASLTAREASRLDRASLFALDAAMQALQDSGLPLTAENAVQAGLVLGCARPGETSVWRGQEAFSRSGEVSAGYLPRTLANSPAAAAAGALGIRGPVHALSAGGASGTAAIALAAGMVRSGEVEVAFAGGTDAALAPAALAGFAALGLLSSRNDEPQRASRPFDADADGMVLAEGAGFVVLESEELARQRGARVYARLAGASSLMEPNATTPSPREAGRSFRAALHQPALMQGEIDYFCAYAAGMPDIDAMENAAIKQSFGEVTASKLTISAPKSMLGHMLGASGAIDAIVCVKAIETGTVPPTINLERPAAGCDLDYTAGPAARSLLVRNALCYAYGSGGHHVALCFSAP
jgi:3-oxoacyl-[acyl-carrier-protein] synthase II